MDLATLKVVVRQHRLERVSFIQSACGPYVIKIDLIDDHGASSVLLKDKLNQVMNFKSLQQCFDTCRKANIHEAELEQWLPQLEACSGYTNTEQDDRPITTHGMPIRF